MTMRRAVFIAFFLLFACRERDPIALTFDAIADAAEERDAKEVMSHVSSDYAGNRAELEATLRRYLFAYQSIDVTLLDLRTRLSGDEAWTTFRVNFIGVPKTLGGIDQYLPRTTAYRFEASLREEQGTWRIVSARWEELGAAPR